MVIDGDDAHRSHRRQRSDERRRHAVPARTDCHRRQLDSKYVFARRPVVGHAPAVSPETTAAPRHAPRLNDNVITLRALTPDDVDAMTAYAVDTETVRWTSIPHPTTSEGVRSWLATTDEGWRTGSHQLFGVESEGRLVGNVGFRPKEGRMAEVGFGLHPAHRGRGLMTRALRLALPWAFDEIGLDVVHWQAHVGNWASRRVAWATGFRISGPVAGLVAHRGTRADGWIGTLRHDDPIHPVNPWYEAARISGRSVLLRPYREDDVPRMVEACRDERTTHWLSGIPANYTEQNAREHQRAMASDMAEGRALFWAVAAADDDRLLAEIGLFTPSRTDRQAEIGYWTHPDARGRGLTTEAVGLAVRHALLPVEEGGLGLRRVLLRAAAGNAASQRVAEKNGFTRSGVDRAADPLRDGTWADDIRFDLLASELPAIR
jgi:RimJ/RimL family protein N-acetyltransferase